MKDTWGETGEVTAKRSLVKLSFLNLKFAKDVIRFVKSLPRTIANNGIIKQLIRASGSAGVKYIEANEAYENLWNHPGEVNYTSSRRRINGIFM